MAYGKEDQGDESEFMHFEEGEGLGGDAEDIVEETDEELVIAERPEAASTPAAPRKSAGKKAPAKPAKKAAKKAAKKSKPAAKKAAKKKTPKKNAKRGKKR